MKKYLKMFVVLCGCAVFSTAVFAAEKQGKAAAADDYSARVVSAMDKSVGSLSEEQKAKIMPLIAERQAAIRKVRMDNKSASKEKRTALEDAEYDKFSAKIRECLTPEQQAKFDKGMGKPQSKK